MRIVAGDRPTALLFHAALVGLIGTLLAGPLRPTALPLLDAGLALAIFYLGTLPTALYLSDARQEPLPLFPLISGFYAISFGLVMFSAAVLDNPLPGWHETTWREALLIGLVGVGMQGASFYFAKDVLFSRVRRVRLPQPLDTSRRLRRLAWPLLVMHAAAVLFGWNSRIPTLGNYLDAGAGYLAVAIFFQLWATDKLARWEKIALLTSVLPIVVARFASGFLGQVVFLAAFVAFLYWHHYRRVPWKMAALCFMFLAVFTPIKQEYRAVAWDLGRYESSLDVTDRARLMVELATTYFDSFGAVGFEDSATQIATRSATILLLGATVSSTPEYVPFWGGETYTPLLTKFVPRFLWPDKPKEEFGNETGHRFGLLGPLDEDTSVNLNQLVEAYANFGWPGVLLVMSVIGFLLGLLNRLLNSPVANVPETILGMSTLFPLAFPESNFSITYGGLPLILVVDYVLLRLALMPLRRGGL